MTCTPSPPLAGRTILVVEDEYFQAEDMAQALAQAGARLVGPYPAVSAAIEALQSDLVIDAAVLDVNLRGQNVFPLAEVLARRGIPFVFATGYDRGVLPQDYRQAWVLEKPFEVRQLIAGLADICEGGGKDP